MVPGNPSYSKHCVVVEGGRVDKAKMPNQQECNKYKDIEYSNLLLKSIHAYNTYVNTHNTCKITHFSKRKSLFTLYN